MATYVLLHGAFHGGWAWRPVAARLQSVGHSVLSPTMPGINDGDDPVGYTLEDCWKAVAKLIVDHDLHDVRLVAHTWGACVALGAVQLVPERIGMFAPFSSCIPSDTSLLSETHEDHQRMFRAEAAASPNNTVTLPFDAWTRDFIQDGSPSVQKLTHELLSPQPLQYFDHAVPALDAATVPFEIRYILADDDLSAPRDTYLAWCARLGCTPIPTLGGHEAMLTQPDALAEVLLSL